MTKIPRMIPLATVVVVVVVLATESMRTPITIILMIRTLGVMTIVPFVVTRNPLRLKMTKTTKTNTQTRTTRGTPILHERTACYHETINTTTSDATATATASPAIFMIMAASRSCCLTHAAYKESKDLRDASASHYLESGSDFAIGPNSRPASVLVIKPITLAEIIISIPSSFAFTRSFMILLFNVALSFWWVIMC